MTSNELLSRVLAALNERFPELHFQRRDFSAKSSEDVGAATRRHVEPGLFRIERETRGVPRKFQNVRIVSEGAPRGAFDLATAVGYERSVLESVATWFVYNPTKADGAFCSGARAFADAPPLFDPAAAESESPYLFAGIELEFFYQ